MVAKSPDAFRTISEVAEDLDLPQHVLRFWETRFAQIKPLKRGGGRRYYRPDDVDLLRGIRLLLYGEGYTISGVQRILKEQGPRFVIARGARRVRRRSRPARRPPERRPRTRCRAESPSRGSASSRPSLPAPRLRLRATPRSPEFDVEREDHDPDDETGGRTADGGRIGPAHGGAADGRAAGAAAAAPASAATTRSASRRRWSNSSNSSASSTRRAEASPISASFGALQDGAGVTIVRPRRSVAQPGSALDWGSRGRRFKSCRSDHKINKLRCQQGSLNSAGYHSGYQTAAVTAISQNSPPPDPCNSVQELETVLIGAVGVSGRGYLPAGP